MTDQSLSLPMTMPTSAVSLIDGSGQEAGGVGGPRPRIAERSRADVDVPDLSTGPDGLAVEVHLGGRVAGHDVAVRAVQLLMSGAEDIGHDRPGRSGPGVAERQVEYRPQVLLELARDRAVHRPVAAVVGAHGQLVDEVFG